MTIIIGSIWINIIYVQGVKMKSKQSFVLNFLFICLLINQISCGSSTNVANKNDQEKISKARALLSNYEIEAKNLLVMLGASGTTSKVIQDKANELLSVSEIILQGAQLKLPKCNDYLTKTLVLKEILDNITNETLEKDYHQDGALPEAPSECYHTKDLFVHPATVLVLVRDDPGLKNKTKLSINAEITEVLVHTEQVRQEVFS